jgi:sec-independent protein translocase protein TatB
MFDIGFWEFALIGVIALIVIGPERMPAVARGAGKYIGKAKHFIAKIQADVAGEIQTDKLKQHLKLNDENANIVEIFNETKQNLKDIEK